jgi:hypothetical protein
MFAFNLLSMIFFAHESESLCKVAWPDPGLDGDTTNELE